MNRKATTDLFRRQYVMTQIRAPQKKKFIVSKVDRLEEKVHAKKTQRLQKTERWLREKRAPKRKP